MGDLKTKGRLKPPLSGQKVQQFLIQIFESVNLKVVVITQANTSV